MKNYIKYLSFCLLTAIGIASCEKNEDLSEPDLTELGGYAYLEDQTITTFDVNEELEINLLSNGSVSFESIEILQNGERIATASLINDSTATFSTSALSNLATINTNEGSVSVPLKIRSMLSNGKVAEDAFTISVEPVISLENDFVSVKLKDTTTTNLSYSIYTFSANVDKVSLLRKLPGDIEFIDTNMNLPTDDGQIDLSAIDYEALGAGIGDTIVYQFVVKSGALKQTAQAEVVILTQDFGSTTTTTLSTTPSMNAYNFGDAAYVNDTIPAEITFNAPMGFSTASGIDFVKANVPTGMTSAEYVADLDLFEAETVYESGTKITSIPAVAMDDVYIYKVTREQLVFYGIIRIENVTSVNGGETVSIDLTFAEGHIFSE